MVKTTVKKIKSMFLCIIIIQKINLLFYYKLGSSFRSGVNFVVDNFNIILGDNKKRNN